MDLNAPIVAKDENGKDIKLETTQDFPKVYDVIVSALRVPLQIDAQTGAQEKRIRWSLLKRLESMTSEKRETQFNSPEKEIILERVSRVYPQIGIWGALSDMLSKAEVSPFPTPKKKRWEKPTNKPQDNQVPA